MGREAWWSSTAPTKLDSQLTFITKLQAVYVLQGCCKLSWLCGELRTLPEAVLQQQTMAGVEGRYLKPSPEQAHTTPLVRLVTTCLLSSTRCRPGRWSRLKSDPVATILLCRPLL